MSRYELPGKETRYRITVGWDNTLPTTPRSNPGTVLPGTLFAQVEDDEWDDQLSDDNKAANVEGEVSCTLSEGLLVWVGQGLDDVVLDVQTLVAAVSPYGNLPLATQIDLLRDMERDLPRSPYTVGENLAAICRQAPSASLALKPDQGKSYYVLIDEHGWHLHEWQSLLTQGRDSEQTITDIVFADDSDKMQYRHVEHVSSYFREDPSIITCIHPFGFTLGLPVFTAFERGMLLSGPVVLVGSGQGLSSSQVQRVAQDAFFVEENIRTNVTNLWYNAWSTIGGIWYM